MPAWTEEDYADYLAKRQKKKSIHKTNGPVVSVGSKTKSKYSNKKVWLDGMIFDSTKEAAYYADLKLLLAAKEIIAFNCQVEFILQEGQIGTKPIIYKADFLVIDKTGHPYYVDVKGFKTDVYKMKKKMLLTKYPNIDFREA